MSRGDVLDGAIIAKPAALSTDEAATAAPEQEGANHADHLRVGDDLLGACAPPIRPTHAIYWFAEFDCVTANAADVSHG